MNNLEAIIDYGSENIRLSVFNSDSKIIHCSKLKINNETENQNSEKSLFELVREAEKKLSIHIDDVTVLYDSTKFYFIDLSIKKSFDQAIYMNNIYYSLIEEANFIISQNNFKDKVIHTIVNNIIVDDYKKLEIIPKNKKIKSLMLEMKFICINKKVINNLLKVFKQNNLNVINIYCSSYTKTFFYKKKFKNINNFIFLDIGYIRTSCYRFSDKKLEFFNSIPVGGFNITKDISKVLNLSFDYSEDLKLNLNKNEKELIFNKNIYGNTNLYSEISEKNISTDLLKQIIEARVNEIIELSIDKNSYLVKKDVLKNSLIIFIGGGSKLLSNDFNFSQDFPDLFFLDDNDSNICEAGHIYNKSEESMHTHTKKKIKKYGFFGRFFHFFAK